MTSPTESTVSNLRVVRAVWMLAGFVAVGVGSVGVILPGIPTVGPFVMAAWCFSKSSPRFEQWVLDLPGVGPMVRDYRAGLGMPKRAKIVAIAMMWTAIAISVGLLLNLGWIAAAVIALGFVGTWWIAIRTPTSP